ncbi:alpha amylase C-terminal domain-containing protein, partial [Streptomyces sp. NPDC059897]|uniref:alpha amylase C-terminal domain-containing protein n=1 Tax=Streptomyces sp. NPDC059897 TaxID=3346994 RepID=UPI003658CB1E
PDWWLLDPAYGAEPDHRGIRDLVRDLNTCYRAAPALWERDTDPTGFRWVMADDADDNVLAFLRHAADGSPLLAICNFAPVLREGVRIGVPRTASGAWQEVLNTDAERYGGSGVANGASLAAEESTACHGLPASLEVCLPPLSALWLTPKGHA